MSVKEATIYGQQPVVMLPVEEEPQLSEFIPVKIFTCSSLDSYVKFNASLQTEFKDTQTKAMEIYDDLQLLEIEFKSFEKMLCQPPAKDETIPHTFFPKKLYTHYQNLLINLGELQSRLTVFDLVDLQNRVNQICLPWKSKVKKNKDFRNLKEAYIHIVQKALNVTSDEFIKCIQDLNQVQSLMRNMMRSVEESRFNIEKKLNQSHLKLIDLECSSSPFENIPEGSSKGLFLAEEMKHMSSLREAETKLTYLCAKAGKLFKLINWGNAYLHQVKSPEVLKSNFEQEIDALLKSEKDNFKQIIQKLKDILKWSHTYLAKNQDLVLKVENALNVATAEEQQQQARTVTSCSVYAFYLLRHFKNLSEDWDSKAIILDMNHSILLLPASDPNEKPTTVAKTGLGVYFASIGVYFTREYWKGTKTAEKVQERISSKKLLNNCPLGSLGLWPAHPKVESVVATENFFTSTRWKCLAGEKIPDSRTEVEKIHESEKNTQHNHWMNFHNVIKEKIDSLIQSLIQYQRKTYSTLYYCHILTPNLFKINTPALKKMMEMDYAKIEEKWLALEGNRSGLISQVQDCISNLRATIQGITLDPLQLKADSSPEVKARIADFENAKKEMGEIIKFLELISSKTVTKLNETKEWLDKNKKYKNSELDILKHHEVLFLDSVKGHEPLPVESSTAFLEKFLPVGETSEARVLTFMEKLNERNLQAMQRETIQSETRRLVRNSIMFPAGFDKVNTLDGELRQLITNLANLEEDAKTLYTLDEKLPYADPQREKDWEELKNRFESIHTSGALRSFKTIKEKLLKDLQDTLTVLNAKTQKKESYQQLENLKLRSKATLSFTLKQIEFAHNYFQMAYFKIHEEFELLTKTCDNARLAINALRDQQDGTGSYSKIRTKTKKPLKDPLID